MDVLTENNAFQNFGNLLRVDFSTEEEIKDFLQICIQIIFYENIYLSPLVPDYVHENSIEIAGKVNSLKSNVIKISSNKLDKEEHENIIEKTANNIAESIDLELKKYLNITENDVEKLLPKLDKKILTLLYIGTNAIVNQDRALLSGELLDNSIKTKQDSSFFEIINKNGKILDSILSFSNKHGWTIAHSYRLISDLRVHPNINVAVLNKAIYSPSIRRAIEGNAARKFYLQFEEMIQTCYQKLPKNECYINHDIKLPSIEAMLFNRGKSNPMDILKVSIELRDHFAPLRKLIKQKEKTKIGVPNILAIENEIEELSKRLYEYIKTDGKHTHTFDIICGHKYELPIGFSIPVIGDFSLTLPNFREIKHDFLLRKCCRAFTEIMNILIDDNYWGWKLKRKSKK
jgi:hypothetical protein